MAETAAAESVRSEGFLLRNAATFETVQNFCDFPDAFALLRCSRLAAQLLLDVGLYEFSARRAALVRTIPPYVAFGLRTESEVQQISLSAERACAPELPPEIMMMAAEVDLSKELQVGSPAIGSEGGLRAARRHLTVTQQAKLTYCFSEGLRAYEEKRLLRSEELLQQALAMVPKDDVLLSRLADTRFARYQCARTDTGEKSEDQEKLKAETEGLYRRATWANPNSSFGYNGLSLFQDCDEMKKKYLLRAVALDDSNSYALTNLGMCLLECPDRMVRTAEVALALLRRALAINPNLFYARPTIATLYLQLRRYDEAVAVLAEHVARRPEDHSSSRLHEYLMEVLAARHRDASRDSDP